MKNSMMIIAVTAAATCFGMWRCQAKQTRKAEYNATALMDSVRKYRTEDSMNAASCAILQLSVEELKRYRSKDEQLIKSLGLRLKRVNSVANVATVGKYEVQVKANNVGEWRYNDPWINYHAVMKHDTIKTNLSIRDTIIQVLHRVPKFKILGIAFGCKGVRQEIVSKNPHTHIVFADYVEIKRK